MMGQRSSLLAVLLLALTSFALSTTAAAFCPAASNAAAAPRFGVVSAGRGGSALSVKIKVEVGDSEPIESALRRFKREVNKSGHLMELRHRRYFENSQEKVKRKVKEGRIRKKFERMQKRRQNNNNNGGGGGGGNPMRAAAAAASAASSPASSMAPRV